jgi:hypothetical protein
MARRFRELWANLQHPQWGGPVMPLSIVLTPGTTNAEYVIWTAPRNVAIRRARVAARADLGAGAVTVTLENATDSEDLTAELVLDDAGVDLDGNASAPFVMAAAADFIDEGDVIVVDYDSDTDPNELVIVLEVEFLELKND